MPDSDSHADADAHANSNPDTNTLAKAHPNLHPRLDHPRGRGLAGEPRIHGHHGQFDAVPLRPRNDLRSIRPVLRRGASESAELSRLLVRLDTGRDRRRNVQPERGEPVEPDGDGRSLMADVRPELSRHTWLQY